MRMKLAWMVNTQPDIAADNSQLAQVTQEHYAGSQKSIIKRLTDTVKYASSHMLQTKYSQLHLESLRIVGYSDAALANNADLT